jgi:hypothetical protein
MSRRVCGRTCDYSACDSGWPFFYLGRGWSILPVAFRTPPVRGQDRVHLMSSEQETYESPFARNSGLRAL